MNLRTIDDAEQALKAYVSANSMYDNYKLDRMHDLMGYLGNPQDELQVIHIAGTSGKTSTSYFIRGLLERAGKTTGLTISPHLVSITERLQLSGHNISDADFIQYLNDFLPRIEQSQIHPTYFELLIALVYSVFQDKGVDYAVIETGLGGLLDATNVVARADKLCVITDIGLDHTEVLGNTVEEIAAQKAGIVQPGNHVLIQHQNQAIVDRISEIARTRGAKSIEIVGLIDIVPGLPAFQQRNWAVAVAAYTHLSARDHLTPPKDLHLEDITSMQPPGRMERFQVEDKTIILDGAHNPQKLRALVESLQQEDSMHTAVIANFISAPEDKLTQSLKELRPVTSHLIIPEIGTISDSGKPFVPADKTAETATALGFSSVEIAESSDTALETLLSLPDQTFLVTGSLYLVAAIRAALISRTQSN